MTSTKIASPIAGWYTNRSIFITGASGFMGKVLLEKLLYSCAGVKTIYILIRAKRGKSPQKRIEDMWKLPIFERLRKTQPDAHKKIVPLVGELDADGLGLSTADINLLADNVSVIFHCAATLKLEATLKDAIEQNTAGTARVIEVARRVKHLVSFLYFSTAFCSADIDVFEEKIYDCKENPMDVIDVARWMSTETLEDVKPRLIHPHPNTYTYSKRLAEKLIANEYGKLPVCVVRPSVVTPAAIEPLPGWVDSLNGPMGLIVGAGKGVIRSMHCKGENRAQVVPVDVAIAAAIVIAERVGTNNTKQEGIPVYNLTQDEVLHITYNEVLQRGRSIVYENPFEMQIWYPDGDIRSSKIIHYLFCLFLHWLPAYLIDFLMLIFRQKRFMVRIQHKIHDGLELLQFFTVREWIFRSSNFLNLKCDMTDADLEMFPMDFHKVSMEDYMRVCVLGARQYLMKEDLSTLPRCRVQQKILFVVHKFCVYGFYAFVLWTLVSWSTSAKHVVSMIGEHAQQMVPVLGNVMPTGSSQ